MNTLVPVTQTQYPVLLKGKNAYPGEFWLLSTKAISMSATLSRHVKVAKSNLKFPPYKITFTDISHKKLGFMCVRLILGQPRIGDFSGNTLEKPNHYHREGRRSGNPSPLRLSYGQSDTEDFIDTTIIKKTYRDQPPPLHPFIPLRSYPLLSGSTKYTMLHCLTQGNEVVYIKGSDAEEDEFWAVPSDLAELSYTLASMLDDAPQNVVPIVLNFANFTHYELGMLWVKLLRGQFDDFDTPKPKRKKIS